jgi:hypothetical protein
LGLVSSFLGRSRPDSGTHGWLLERSKPMRMRAIGLVVPLTLSAGAVFAADQGRSYASGQFQLSIDGTSVGYVESVAGGGIKADVVNSPAPERGQAAAKHVASPRLDDVEVQLGLGGSANVYDWIDNTLGGNPQRRNLSLVECTADLKAILEQPLSNTLITEVVFPALDAQAPKAKAFLTLKLTPELAPRRLGKGSCTNTSQAAKQQKQWMGSNFRLELNGIDTTGVLKVAPFTVRLAANTASVGEQRDYVKESGKLEIPDLTISVSRERAAEFEAWAEDFLLKGNNGSEKEKSGALVFLDPTLKSELGRVSLSNVGIAGLETDKSNPMHLSVRLYVEGMRLSVGGNKPKALKLKAAATSKTAPAKLTPAAATKKPK